MKVRSNQTQTTRRSTAPKRAAATRRKPAPQKSQRAPRPDRAQVSKEARQPEGKGKIPNFGNAFGGPKGEALGNQAATMTDKPFKAGQTKRCADFVSTMMEQSGTTPPGFKHEMSAEGLSKYGKGVNAMGDLKKGDLVMFGNTYRKGKYTHVGIYQGEGKFTHRPTANKPVQTGDLNSPYWQSKFTEGRRLD